MITVRDLTAIGLALLLSFAGVHLLWLDLRLGDQGLAGESLASIETATSDVRRRMSASFLWNRVSGGHQLYRKDAVRTGPTDSVMIRMNDGTSIQILEDSLVVLDPWSDLPLRFHRGGGVVRGGTFSKKVTIDPETGELVERTLPLQITSPESGSILYVRDSQSARDIFVRWSGNTQDPLIEITRMSDPGSKPWIVTPTSAGNAEFKLGPGRYFARLRESDQSEKDLSDRVEFQIAVPPDVRPVFPNSRSELVLHGSQRDVQFRWIVPSIRPGDPVPGQHWIDLSRSSDFKEITSIPIAPAAGAFIQAGVGDGQQYWRIRSRYGELEKISPVESWQLARRKPRLDVLQPRSGLTHSLGTPLRISWESESHEIFRYSWRILRDGKDAESGLSDAHAFQWNPRAPGAYQIQISAMDQDQVVSSSEWVDFAVVKGNPLEIFMPSASEKVESFTSGGEPLQFKWKGAPEESHSAYEIEIAKDHAFTNVILRKKVTVPEFETRELPEGDYYWRLHAYSASGEVQQTTAIRKFSYGRPDLLPAPDALLPEVGQVVDLSQDALKLEWNVIRGNHGYSIVIREGDASGRTVLEKDVSRNMLELPLLPEGRYQWSVHTRDRSGRRGPASISRVFQVRHGEPPPPPELKSPEGSD